ncbi:hypothetical protein O181_005963 [Austropuccinia psidii MF-1]|uniref:Uncharacterized protein n=1 Tax=Austropuccinia psidii MF-1 TaxID=1389203 RepID=A0A9Q3BJ99_9BASI|nr:hypothetical protein [Austropuccinia psidii MF-1]
MKEDLIEIFFQNKEAFASDNEPLGYIEGHEVNIMLNVGRPYPPLLRRPAYTDSPRARKELETHINELKKLGVCRKVGYNEEIEVTTPVVTAWHNNKSGWLVILENLIPIISQKGIQFPESMRL